LRFSLRSLEQNLMAVPTVWVIGDKPPWYTGNHIPHERLKVNRHRARLDRAAKLWQATNDPRLGDDFIWMMDDVYFTQPVTLHEIRIPFKAYEMDSSLLAGYRPHNQWQREKLLGWQALAQAGRPLDDFTAHLPFIYEKDKLRKVFEKYDLLNQ